MGELKARLINNLNRIKMKKVIIIIITLINVLQVRAEIDPQGEFGLHSGWKIIRNWSNELLNASSRISFKDSLNGVILNLLVDKNTVDSRLFIDITSDGGKNWNNIYQYQLPPDHKFLRLFDILYHSNTIIVSQTDRSASSTDTLACTTIWKSNNKGLTWEEQKLPYNELGNSSLTHRPELILINDTIQLISYKNNLLRTTNSGKEWIDILNNIPIESENKYISDIEYANGKIFCLCFNNPLNSIFISNDNGDSWEPAGITNIPAFTKYLKFINDSLLLVTGGFPKSTNWKDTLFFVNLNNNNVKTINVSTNTQHYFIGFKYNFCLIGSSIKYLFEAQFPKMEFKNIGANYNVGPHIIDFEDIEIFENKVLLTDRYYGSLWEYKPLPVNIEETEKLTCSLFPNPTRNGKPIYIGLKNEKIRTIIVKIYDETGLLNCVSPEINLQIGNHTIDYTPKTTLTPGTYFIVISSNGEVLGREKFVVVE